MIVLAYIAFAALGAITASFINVVTLRMYTGRPLLVGRSQCDSCTTLLSWFELIPIFSFFVLRGRCRTCGSLIGRDHIIAELLLALLFVGAYMLHGISILLLLSLLFFALVLGIVLYDMRHTIIPNIFVYPLIALGFIVFFIEGIRIETFIAALVISALFAFIWLVSQGRAMGFGDAKFVLALALFVGYPLSITGFVLSFWIGAVVSVALLVFSSKGRTMNHEVPFAPYLALGFICAYLLQFNLLPVIFF